MKELLIDVQSKNTKVCIVEDGELVEFWVERKNISRLVGNVYKGKVVNVLNGMQAAFVNIGLERNAFLYAGDTLEYKEELRSLTNQKLNMRPGDEVVCQVLKDEFGCKGARISENISLPGRVLVLMPQIDYVGVSRKITDTQRREELAEFVRKIKPDGSGFILRTQSAQCSEQEIKDEMDELLARWQRIQSQAMRKPAGSLVYKEEDLAIRAVRDMLTSDVERVLINDRKLFEEFKAAFPYVLKQKPNLFEYYNGNEDLIKHFRLSKQIETLLSRKVVMKNGAYLVIDRNEALTVIDVNTGKYVGEKNLEETVFETNKAAACEIARQLRLRNIGGMVIIDFIDMELPEHTAAVMSVLEEALAKDRTKTTLVDMTPLGLVELTRKKTRSMLESVMLQTCPYCNGDGYVKSDEHMVMIIKDKLTELFSYTNAKAVKVRVSPSVFNKLFAFRLLEKECAGEWADKRIYIIPDGTLHIEKFDVEPCGGAIIDLPDSAKMLY